MSEQDPSNVTNVQEAKKTLLKRATAVGGVLAWVAAPGLVFGAAWKLTDLRLDRIYGETNYRNLDPSALDKTPKEELDLRFLPYELANFNKKIEQLNAAFFEFAKRKGTEQALTIFEEIALDHLIKGLNVIKQIDQGSVEYLGNSNGQLLVRIADHAYDLNYRFDFQQAFALTSLKFDAFQLKRNAADSNEHNRLEEIKQQIHENKLDQEAITWLKTQQLKIGITQNSVLFAKPNQLATYARALKLITQQLGYPPPKTALLGPGNQGGIYLEVKMGPLQLHPPTVNDYSDALGDISSLVHELGHYLAARGHQETFNKTMEAAEKLHLKDVKIKQNVTFYTYKPENRVEQFADFFAMYFSSGKYLQEDIAELQKEDPAAAKILESGLNFFKNLFSGQEFVKNGLTKEDLTPKGEKTADKYNINQYVKINDKDTNLPGVLLRTQPEATVRIDSPAVFDQDQVQIINGPHITRRSRYDTDQRRFVEDEIKWWEVEIGTQDFFSHSQVGYLRGKRGFIEEKYLGDVISRR